MTREEAIEIVQSGAGIWPMTGRANNALNMAIKALEQEPCEDTISRQDALGAVFGPTKIADIYQEIRDLPPVTPKQRPGAWVYDSFCGGFYQCSVCGHDQGSKTNYCPKCGARMTEVADD